MNTNFKNTKIICDDNYEITASIFEPKGEANSVVIINSATGISRSLYIKFANYLSQNNFVVITYDYKGIADSKPDTWDGFYTDFYDWGHNDFGGVIKYAKEKYPNKKLLVIGHSIGGTIMGMTPLNTEIAGFINIGAQTAYYKDWHKSEKIKLYFLWHIVIPALTQIFGYFPGKALKIMEDIPKGVVKQWTKRRKHPSMVHQMEAQGKHFYFENYKNEIFSILIEDDPIGTLAAVNRLNNYFTNAPKKMVKIKPEKRKIGHFGFFRSQFQNDLWPIALEALQRF